ncbi:MAG: hypothetical protein ACAH95_05965 [Fimbriimonas sp.]
MSKRRRNGSKWIIVSALALGVSAGYVLTHGRNTEFKFLRGAKAIAVRDASVETSGGTIRGTTTYFSFEGDWDKVYALAKAEMPDAFERDTIVGGQHAKVLTIPRVENGRLRLFFPPVREITILPERLVLTEGGQLMTQESDKHFASVKISEYRQPHVLDTAVDWLRDQLNI